MLFQWVPSCLNNFSSCPHTVSSFLLAVLCVTLLQNGTMPAEEQPWEAVPTVQCRASTLASEEICILKADHLGCHDVDVFTHQRNKYRSVPSMDVCGEVRGGGRAAGGGWGGNWT